ncbi:MAG: hypothetical protein QXM83_04995 [Ignisphaera sp.]
MFLSACIEIPKCIELNSRLKPNDKNKLYVEILNTCEYDLVLSLYIGTRDNKSLYSFSIELNAKEKKHIEIPLEDYLNIIVISGEWGLKGTTLKIPLEEVVIYR